MAIGIDRQISAEREAREREALTPKLTPVQMAAAHRKAAVAEGRTLLDLMARRDSLPEGKERDELTREINDESRPYIDRHLAKADELTAPQQIKQAAE